MRHLMSHLQPKRLSLWLTLLCGLTLCACDDQDDPSTSEGGAESGVMAGLESGAESGAESGVMASLESGAESGVEGGGAPLPPTCELSAPRSLELLPALRSTQIHPDATWDGEGFWVTWTIPNDEGKFEIWAGRFGCELNTLVEPFALSQVSGMNDTDSSVAVSGEVALVMWSRDNSFADGATYNLSVQTRALDRVTGAPLGEAQPLQLTLEGEPQEGNFWMAQLKALNTGGFAFSASWGNNALNTFQVVVGTLDEGAQLQEAWLAYPEGRDQVSSELSVTGETIDVLWQGSGEGGAEGYWGRTWRRRGGAWQADDLLDLTSRGWLSAHVGRGLTLSFEQARGDTSALEEGAPWLIGSQSGGVVELISPQGEARSVGPRSATSLGPKLSTGLIASYQRISNTQSKVWWRSVNEGEALSEVTLFPQDGPAAPYPLSITPYPGGYLALWAQGQNPEFMLKATLLPAPARE